MDQILRLSFRVIKFGYKLSSKHILNKAFESLLISLGQLEREILVERKMIVSIEYKT